MKYDLQATRDGPILQNLFVAAMINDETKYFEWEKFLPADIAADSEYGTKALVEKLSWLLSRQTVVLEELHSKMESRRLAVAGPLSMAICDSTKAAILLARNNYGNEIFPLLRSALERIITIYYLQCCHEEEFHDYIDYSKQKAYRSFSKEIEINGKSFFQSPSASTILESEPELKRLVSKFTSPNSKKPRTYWSPVSIKDKLALIDSSNTQDISAMMLCLLEIYDDASEVLHGTLYGCLFHVGEFQLGKPVRHVDEWTQYYLVRLCGAFYIFTVLLGELGQFFAIRTQRSDLINLASAARKQATELVSKSWAMSDSNRKQ